MFEEISERMLKALRNFRGIGKLTDENMAEALKEVETALLSADVNFKVVKDFIQRIQTACQGEEVLKSVTPGQFAIKKIHDELVVLLGEGEAKLVDKKPLKLMMVGLHGSGKTTTSVKLARYLKGKGYKVGLVACDVYRPAAMDQLEILGKQEGFDTYVDREEKNVVQLGKKAMKWADAAGYDAIIFDTAGRLQIDEKLIEEIRDLKNAIVADEVLLIVDSAIGQEAVSVGQGFHEGVGLTGMVLTKMDGDARGGAALSVKTMVGVPIKFIGMGEKTDQLSIFHPERMANRILGMGDVVSLVEKAQETIDKEEADRLAKKFKRAEFDLEDFLTQMRQLKRMGSISSLAKMIPMGGDIKMGEKDEKNLQWTEAILLSMTPYERANPHIINGSRRLRIANGAGVKVFKVNELLKQFQGMKKLMKSFKGGKGKDMEKQLRSMAAGGRFPF